MSATSDRYRRLAANVTDKISAVPADKWAAPSPCPDWTALDVVRHLTQTPAIFFGLAGEQPPDVPPVDDGPLAAWEAARDATQAALDDPAIAEKEFDGFTGRSTFEKGVDRFVCTDLIVHGWDLARAVGLDERIDPRDLADVRSAMEPMGEMLRSPQAFGPEIDVPAESDEQTKVLAFLGRRA